MVKKHSDETAEHVSFRLSRRGDYGDTSEVPGFFSHIMATFGVMGNNSKAFIGVIVVGVVAAILLVGLMSQMSYSSLQSTIESSAVEMGAGKVGNFALAWLSLVPTLISGGISEQSSEAGVVSFFFIFLVVWLSALYITRGFLGGRRVKLEEALYKSGAPLVSTLMVLFIIILECLPIILLIVVYAAAVTTDFLTMPFYALLFLGFAAAMVAIPGYLLPNSVMALTAVSAPGLYPIRAISATRRLMAGRKIGFLIRVLVLILVLFVIWAIVMLPIIALDLGLKNFDWAKGIPFVPFCALVLTCFSEVFAAIYLYIYYKWMVDYEKK